MPVHPAYIVCNPDQPQVVVSSIPVLRSSDTSRFLATVMPKVLTKNPITNELDTDLISAILPVAATPISRILNHTNIISLVDIIHTSSLYEPTSEAGQMGNLTVFEDMEAGCLAYILPSANNFPGFRDKASWDVLASQNFQRYSLPESLCWHVLRSISQALLWLHHGITSKLDGSDPENWVPVDEDWQPILIRDVSPGQIWFSRPKKDETYGECKLGGFGNAKVASGLEGRDATTTKDAKAQVTKQYYWAPEVYTDLGDHSRASEIWSLGAVIYCMMTGIPPSRCHDYDWNISRMNDKGYSPDIRDIVASMLSIHPDDRLKMPQLVDRMEEDYRKWRATTDEGMEYVEDDDEWQLSMNPTRR